MGEFISGITIGVIVGTFFGATLLHTSWSSEAIERGYAWYCPYSGKLAWKNECKETVVPKD